MLEGLIAWVLNTYVGEYLENLNTEQLSVALLQGQVELANVPLKKTALRKFDVPLEVKSGVIGRLALHVPLSRVRSSPWQVHVSDVCVLLSPQQAAQPAAASHGHRVDGAAQTGAPPIDAAAEKVHRLEMVERRHKRDLLFQLHPSAVRFMSTELLVDGLSPAAAAGSTWYAGLAATVVENIQLVVQNVHIRIEDAISLPNGRSFAAGIKIKRLSVQTTDQFWNVRYVNRSEGENLFKILEIEEMSLYWDSGARPTQLDADGIRQLKGLLNESNLGANSYILYPTSVLLDVSPDSVALEMSKLQLDQIRLWTNEWARYDRGRPYRKWRPNVPVFNNARTWWRFAATCTTSDAIARAGVSDWQQAAQRASQLNAYARAYAQRLRLCVTRARNLESDLSTGDLMGSEEDIESSHLEESSDEVKALGFMKQIERSEIWSYTDLLNIREAALHSIRRSYKLSHKTGVPISKAPKPATVRDANSTKPAYSKDAKNLWTPLSPISPSTADLQTYFGTFQSESEENKISENNDHTLTPRDACDAAEGGIYNWLSGWWWGAPPQTQHTDAATVAPADDDTDFEHVSKPTSQQHTTLADAVMSSATYQKLPDDLKEVERNLGDEIVDVLQQSWDDTNLLRRDNLLCKMVLHLTALSWRLVHEKSSSSSGANAKIPGPSGAAGANVLSLELSGARGELRLSPRHHSIALALRVDECNAHAEVLGDNVDSPVGHSSLLWAQSVTNTFALGRAPGVTDKCSGAMLKLVYERHAPKLVPKHRISLDLSPIAVLYHERALQHLAAFFKLESSFGPLVTAGDPSSHDDVSRDTEQRWSEVSATVRSPSVTLELRSDLGAPFLMPQFFSSGKLPELLSAAESQPSSTFACVKANDLCIKVESNEPCISDVEVTAANFTVENLFNADSTRDDGVQMFADPPCLLKATGRGDFDRRRGILRHRSISCPNMNFSDTEEYPYPITADDEPMLLGQQIGSTNFGTLPRRTFRRMDNGQPRLELALSGAHEQSRRKSRRRIHTECTQDDVADLRSFGPGVPSRQEMHYTDPIDRLASTPGPKSPANAWHQRRRRRSATGHDATRLAPAESVHDACLLRIRHVSERHPEFARLFGRVSHQIELHLHTLNIGLSRDPWTLLLDFFGLISPANGEGFDNSNNGAEISDICVKRITLWADLLDVELSANNDGSSTCEERLAKLCINDVRAAMLADPDTFTLEAEGSEVELSPLNCAAGVSSLYPQRLFVRSAVGSPCTLKLVKHSGVDKDLQRDCDVAVQLDLCQAESIVYVHMHRFLVEFVSFWSHWAQLMDVATKVRSLLDGNWACDLPTRSSRVRLSVNANANPQSAPGASGGRVCVAVPMCDRSNKALLALVDSVTIRTEFDFATAALEEFAANFDENEDCLLEVLSVNFKEMSLHCSKRVDNVEKPASGKKKIGCTKSFAFLCDDAHSGLLQNSDDKRDAADNFCAKQNSMDLCVKMIRNLDAVVCDKVPPLSIHGCVSLARLRVPAQLYTLLRGVIELNLGQNGNPVDVRPPALISAMQVVEPVQPSSADENRATFSCRFDIFEVVFDLELSEQRVGLAAHLHKQTPCHHDFATVELRRAKVTFDSFADGSTELDVICNDLRLIDTRFEGYAANNRPNQYTIMLESCREERSDVDPFQESADRLLAELHVLSSAQTHRTTFVLSECRLTVLPDWWYKLANFVSMTFDDCDFAIAKSSGVISRNFSEPKRISVEIPATSEPEMESQNCETKVNLRNCDLVLIEIPKDRSTLGLLIKTTVALYIRADKTSVEVQSAQVFAASLRASVSHKRTSPDMHIGSQLSNDFSLVVRMETLPAVAEKEHSAPPGGAAGLHAIADCAPCMQNVNVDVHGLVARLSYCDYLVLSAVLARFKGQWDDANSSQIVASSLDSNKANTVLNLVTASSDSLCVWLLDDFEDTRFPLLRFGIDDMRLVHCVSVVPAQGHCLNATIFVDFFNQSVYAWEPLVEPWIVDSATWLTQGNYVRLDLKAALGVLDVNVSQPFVRQFTAGLARFAQLRHSLDMEFRSRLLHPSISTKGIGEKCDHLPYILHNNTGLEVTFYTTDSGASAQKRRSDAKKAKMVAAGASVTFEFAATRSLFFKSAASHHLESDALTASRNQLVVTADGFHECQPLCVDRAGTYFRLAAPRDDCGKVRADALRPGNMYARIVAVVNTDQDGRKVITVRSALLLVNALSDWLEVRLENSTTHVGDTVDVLLAPGECQPAPLAHAVARLTARPRPDKRSAVSPTSSSGADACAFGTVGHCNSVPYQCVRSAGQRVDFLRNCYDVMQPRDRPVYRLCVCVQREHYPMCPPHVADQYTLPGHTITFAARLVLCNLTPESLQVTLYGRQMAVPAGTWRQCDWADTSDGVSMQVSTESLHTVRPLHVKPPKLFALLHQGAAVNDRSQQNELADWEGTQLPLTMVDAYKRQLKAIALVHYLKGGTVKVSICAPYWIVNQTGLPIVVKQEAAADLAAGQFSEHEQARSKVPLMFSFAEDDCPKQCALRLGLKGHDARRLSGVSHPVWCTKFPLQQGVISRRLKLIYENSNSADVVYDVGVEVRAGAGVHKHTTSVVLSAKYQLLNTTNEHFLVAQNHQVTQAPPSSSQSPPPTASIEFASIAPSACLVWHWPNAERDQLLRVRPAAAKYWSEPFRIDASASFELALRCGHRLEFPMGAERGHPGGMWRVRVQVSQWGGGFRVALVCVPAAAVGSEPEPEPVRVCNNSDVPLLFRQHECNEQHQSDVIQPHSSLPYAWDNPMKQQAITLTAYRSKSVTYDLTVQGEKDKLYYQNYFFIAFAASFEAGAASRLGQEHTQLVLDALPDGKVILNQMDKVRESQLWRTVSPASGSVAVARGSERCLLENVHLAAMYSTNMVLDTLGPVATTSQTALVVRRADATRLNSQAWTFQSSRLVPASMGIGGVYVQPANGCLASGQRAVLAPDLSSSGGYKSQSGVADDACARVVKRRERPGSGALRVHVTFEGPTRVLHISDAAAQQAVLQSGSGSAIASAQSVESGTGPGGGSLQYDVTVQLDAGLGLSVVAEMGVELLYARLIDLQMHTAHMSDGQRVLALQVFNVQADNQMVEGRHWQLLYTREQIITSEADTSDDNSSSTSVGENALRSVPALNIDMLWERHPTYDAYQHCRVFINRTSLQMEETLLWRLMKFMRDALHVEPNEHLPHVSAESAQWSIGADSVPQGDTTPGSFIARRCYFGQLVIHVERMYLSMDTRGVASLPAELAALKSQWNVPLVKFENASVHLAPFLQNCYFETYAFLLDAVREHFERCLRGQAVNILGTVDFLGNPLGLIEDISGGFQDLLLEGNVSGLVSGIGHGLTNTVAKVTSSLSDGVGAITMDKRHQLTRMRARQYAPHVHGGSAALGHLYTGVKGLGIGFVGGLSSLAGGMIDGFKSGGSTGLLVGAGVGAVGTVTKPIQGVLDLASGAAAATQELVTTGGRRNRVELRQAGHPLRPARVPGVPLQRYNRPLAEAQRTLARMHGGTLSSGQQNRRVGKTTGSLEAGLEQCCISQDVCLQLAGGVSLVMLVCTEKCYLVRQRVVRMGNNVANESGSSVASTSTGDQLQDVRVRLSVDYRDIDGVRVISYGDKQSKAVYLEIKRRVPGARDGEQNEECDQIQCFDRRTAEMLCQKILHAKQQHDDLKRSLPIPEDTVINFMAM